MYPAGSTHFLMSLPLRRPGGRPRRAPGAHARPGVPRPGHRRASHLNLDRPTTAERAGVVLGDADGPLHRPDDPRGGRVARHHRAGVHPDPRRGGAARRAARLPPRLHRRGVRADDPGDDRAPADDRRVRRHRPRPAAASARCRDCFARVLRYQVRELGAVSLETAIHKMSGFVAERYRLRDRGLLRAGLRRRRRGLRPGDGRRPRRRGPSRGSSRSGSTRSSSTACVVADHGRWTGELPGAVLAPLAKSAAPAPADVPRASAAPRRSTRISPRATCAEESDRPSHGTQLSRAYVWPCDLGAVDGTYGRCPPRRASTRSPGCRAAPAPGRTRRSPHRGRPSGPRSRGRTARDQVADVLLLAKRIAREGSPAAGRRERSTRE